MDLGLNGKRCPVTGSTGGIGLEVVRQLVTEEAPLSSPVADVPRRGSARRRTSSRTWLATASPSASSPKPSAALGGLDVLVNNVGTARIARFEEVPDEEWLEYWQLNVMSYVRRSVLRFRPCEREEGRS